MSLNPADRGLTEAIQHHAMPLGGALADYDPLVEAAKGRQFVLMGEATHGTTEFYRARAEITQRLISEAGFDAVAVEADWPDAYFVNCFVKAGKNQSAEQALARFERFPTWMWRNLEVLHFVEWLRAHNLNRVNPAGFYGLDLYSMNTSIHAVISYLESIDPEAAVRARQRYGCLDHFMDNPQSYGYATEMQLMESCEEEIIEQLIDLRRRAKDYLKQDGLVAEDAYFCAEQNAKLVRNAEEYYRSLYRGRPSSWNLRDQHMFETLEDLAGHLGARLKRNARIVVWAHNSHIGNAKATDMSRRGELNIGQLARQVYGDKALLVGFTTCRGTVTAASDWDEPYARKRVREPLPGSYEALFHHVNRKQFMLDLREANKAVDGLMEPRLERAIGVVYRPDSERHSHYFKSCLPEQFDFLLHYDETHAVEPLAATPQWHRGELDETYPSGL